MTNATTHRPDGRHPTHAGTAEDQKASAASAPRPRLHRPPMPGDVVHIQEAGYAVVLPRNTYLPSEVACRILARQRGAPAHHMEGRSLELAEDCRQCGSNSCTEEQTGALKGNTRKEAVADLIANGRDGRQLAYASHCQMTAEIPHLP